MELNRFVGLDLIQIDLVSVPPFLESNIITLPAPLQLVTPTLSPSQVKTSSTSLFWARHLKTCYPSYFFTHSIKTYKPVSHRFFTCIDQDMQTFYRLFLFTHLEQEVSPFIIIGGDVSAYL